MCGLVTSKVFRKTSEQLGLEVKILIFNSNQFDCSSVHFIPLLRLDKRICFFNVLFSLYIHTYNLIFNLLIEVLPIHKISQSLGNSAWFPHRLFSDDYFSVQNYDISDVLNHYTIEASTKKDAQVAYITTPDAAVHSVYGFYINYFSVHYDISLICSSATCLFRPQWRHNPYKYFDFCGG